MDRERKKRCWLAPIMVLLVGIVIFAVPNVGTKTVCSQGGCPPGYSNPGCSGAYKAGNCTCYAWKRANDSGTWGEYFSEKLQDAHLWNDNAPDYKYKVGAISRPNSIAVWEENVQKKNGTPFTWEGGHVAYVESVSGDNFTVSHMNFCGRHGCAGCLTTSTFNVNDFYSRDLHFIYSPNAPPQVVSPSFGQQIEYGDSATLEWQGGQKPYEIEIYVAVNASAPRNESGLLSRVWGIDGTAVDLYDLENSSAFFGRHEGWPNGYPLPLGTYYWHIKGSVGEWSNWQMFQLVDCQPGNTPYGNTEEPESNLLVRFWDWVKSLFGVQAAEDATFCPSQVAKPTSAPTSTPIPPALTTAPTRGAQLTNTPRPTRTSVPEPTYERGPCQDESRPGVYVYSESNFEGNCTHITAGCKNLDTTYVGDNNARSIKVVGDYQAELFENRNCQGRSDEFHHDERKLDDRSLGRQYSSVRVSREVTPTPTPTSPPASTDAPPTGSPAPTPVPMTIVPTPTSPPAPTATPSLPPLSDYNAQNAGTLENLTVDFGESFQITIKVRNTGVAIWKAEDGVLLSRISAGQLNAPSELQLDPGERVNPGEVRSWTITVTAPQSRGTWWLSWRMTTQYSGHWFGDEISTEVKVGASLEEYDTEDAGTPDEIHMKIGETIPVTIKVRNTGSAVWKADRGTCLHNISKGHMGTPNLLRLNPGEEVKPGEVRSWTTTLEAPGEGWKGTYTVSWRMDEKGCNYFFGDTISIKVYVE